MFELYLNKGRNTNGCYEVGHVAIGRNHNVARSKMETRYNTIARSKIISP